MHAYCHPKECCLRFQIYWNLNVQAKCHPSNIIWPTQCLNSANRNHPQEYRDMILLSTSNSSKNISTMSSLLSIHDLLLKPKAMTQSVNSYHFMNNQATVCYLTFASHKHRNCFTSLKWRKSHTILWKKKPWSTGRQIACKADKDEDSNMTKRRMIGQYPQKYLEVWFL